MVVLDCGEESTTISLINIVKTSVTINGENFNIIPSFKQKYYVKMPTNLIPMEEFEKGLEPNMVDLDQENYNHWKNNGKIGQTTLKFCPLQTY
jgi:hypothetical protein